ncbi:MAG: response regulator [Saccharofermentans sp.]|nr:response regulator [Saccharofermentans sp.]
MNIFVIDDEEMAVELLVDAINEVCDDAEITTFYSAAEALDKLNEVKPDVIFTDISMPEMTGLEFAKRVKSYSFKTNIIFATGYSQYTRDAITLHASGYVTKPVTPDKVRQELDNLLYPVDVSKSGVYIHTFGNFELLKNGTPVHFNRDKSKELFALIVDRQGEEITNDQAATYLFPEEAYSSNIKNQVTTIASDLFKTLKKEQLTDIVTKGWGTFRLNVDKVKCDAYDFTDGQPYAINLFHGEYMENYSWSEVSKAKFYWDKQGEE